MSLHIVAFDLSLSNTGWATGSAVGSWRNKPSEYSTTEKVASLMPRIARMACSKAFGADLVVLESPALGSATGRAHARAGLWWLVYLSLVAEGLKVVEVAPSTLKKWATGRGNAGKPDVLTAVIRLWPERDVSNEDEADALALWSMAAQAKRVTNRGLSAERQKQLDKIMWR